MAWFINRAFCSKKKYILMWNGVTYFIGVYITKNNGTLHVHLEIQKFEIFVWKNISLICLSTFQVRFRISKRPCIVSFYMYILCILIFSFICHDCSHCTLLLIDRMYCCTSCCCPRQLILLTVNTETWCGKLEIV